MFKMLVLLLAFTVSHSAWALDHTHAEWTTLLKRFVTVKGAVSQVDYSKFKSDTSALATYLKKLSDVKRTEYDSFSEAEKMAFLINAYNAFTVKIILDHYPVKSINDIGSFFKNTWKIKFFTLLGKEMNLDEIEHQNLRKNFSEPRIHFAVNCASIGCPALRGEAFTSAQLDAQLQDQTKLFLRDSTRNQLDVKAKSLKLSMIFKWFKEDFEKGSSSVAKFVAPFITDDLVVQKSIAAGEFKIGFLDYDWGLNQVSK